MTLMPCFWLSKIWHQDHVRAPGRSTFNQLERRMVPLISQLSGITLSHDQYRSHFNKAGIAIDDDLEKENFKLAGETLEEIWSN